MPVTGFVGRRVGRSVTPGTSQARNAGRAGLPSVPSAPHSLKNTSYLELWRQVNWTGSAVSEC